MGYGGPEINLWLGKLGIEPQFKDGLRVTDAPTMDVVEMVLVGRVNKELVSLINQEGGKAVGLCGVDGNLITARPQGAVDVGCVGEVSSIDSGILKSLVESGYIPIVSSVASDETGQAYNINADTVAGEIAAALGQRSHAAIHLGNHAPGHYPGFDQLPGLLNIQLRQQGRGVFVVFQNALCVGQQNQLFGPQGVGAAHILDGRVPHALLLEIFTDLGIGSMIVASELRG